MVVQVTYVERGSGRCFLVPVEKRDAATLLLLIHEYILLGTMIYSEKWAAYNKKVISYKIKVV